MFKKILNTASTQFLGSIFNFLTFIVISRLLGPYYREEAGIMLSTIAFILVASNLVSGASLIYLFPRVHKPTLIYISYGWSAFISALAFVILKIYNQFEPLLGQYIFHICMLAFLNAFFNVNLQVLISEEKINTANRLKLFHFIPIFPVVFIAIYLLKIENSNAYMYGLYTGYLSISILSLYQIRKHLKPIKLVQIKSIIKDAFKFGAWNQAGNLVQTLNLRLSYYILHDPNNLSSIALGNYSNAVSICEAIWIVTRSVALVQYARISNSKDNKYNVKLTLSLSKWSFIICSIGIIPIVMLPSNFFQFIFGQEFYLIADIIKWLAPSVVLYNFAYIIAHYYSGNGRYQINLISSSIGLVVTLSCIHYFIELYSQNGAALTATLSYLASSIFMLSYFSYQHKLNAKQFLPTWQELKFLTKK